MAALENEVEILSMPTDWESACRGLAEPVTLCAVALYALPFARTKADRTGRGTAIAALFHRVRVSTRWTDPRAAAFKEEELRLALQANVDPAVEFAGLAIVPTSYPSQEELTQTLART